MLSLCLFTAIIAPLVSALTLQAPSGATSGGQVTLMWSSDAGDPDTWSFELVNTVFHNSFAIANNVNPQPQQLSIQFPIVPAGDGYTLEAVNIGNISDIYATSPDFAISGTSSSLASGASTASTATTPVVTPRTTTTAAGLTTVVQPSTSPNASPTSTTSTSSIPTAASSSGSPRRLDFNIGGLAASFFAISGAVILAL